MNKKRIFEMTTYIILAAGKGENLQPLTLKYPKSLYKLDDETTVLQRMVRSIRKFDMDAEIVVVIGFMYKSIMKEMLPENVKFVHNPFYSVTGSLGSLWFAREYLQRENVVIINGDVVCEDRLMKDVICTPTEAPVVLVDSELTNGGKYNVQIQGERVCVMSKQLTAHQAIYASITKLDAVTSRFMLEGLETMVNEEMYDRFYEDVLVQLIFAENFELYYKNIKNYRWVEVDSVDDLMKAKDIHNGFAEVD